MYNAYDFIQIMFRDQRLPQRKQQQQREFEDRVARERERESHGRKKHSASVRELDD